MIASEPEFLNFTREFNGTPTDPCTKRGCSESMVWFSSRDINTSPRVAKRRTRTERVAGQYARGWDGRNMGGGWRTRTAWHPTLAPSATPSSASHPPSDAQYSAALRRLAPLHPDGRNDCRVYWVTITTWLTRIVSKNIPFNY